MRKRALPRGWYPGTAEECNREIDSFLQGFTPPEGAWTGGVAPHAGWYFSGRAAARVFATVAAASRPDRVVLYGGHLQAASEPIVYPEGWWDTPMGPQPMDTDVASDLIRQGKAVSAPRMFADNTVEVQLPFVRRFFPNTPMIAVHAPSSEKSVRLGESLVELMTANKLKAVFIGSADLTHYGPNYGFTPKGLGPEALRWVKEENDRALLDKAVAMDAKSLLDEAAVKRNTCSAGPIAAVIASAAKLGAQKGKLLEYYTSYDIMPDPSFVGYAAIVY